MKNVYQEEQDKESVEQNEEDELTMNGEERYRAGRSASSSFCSSHRVRTYV